MSAKKTPGSGVSPKKSKAFAISGLVIAMILWGSSFIAMKIAFKHYAPFFVIFGRMAVASIGFLFFSKQIFSVRIKKKDIWFLMFMALCEPCMYFILEALALQHTTASQSAMITSILPLLVAFAAWLFLGEDISGRSITGFCMAVTGGIWLSVSGEATVNAPNPELGNLLEFMAMLCAAGYTVTLKYLTGRFSSIFLTGFQCFIGTFFFGAFIIFKPSLIPSSFHAESILMIVYLGIAVSMIAYGLYNYGVSVIPANQASAFTNLIPVVGIIMGWMFLGERFTLWQHVASMLVFAGIFITQTRKKQALANKNLKTGMIS